jgi:hypothetical protein
MVAYGKAALIHASHKDTGQSHSLWIGVILTKKERGGF